MSGPGEVADRRGIEARRRWCTEVRLLAHAEAAAGAGAPPLRLSDTAWVGRLPDWVRAGPEARAELALLAGAVFCAKALRRTVDGRVLQPLAARIGADRLAALAALRTSAAPPDDWHWGEDPVAGLGAIGAEVLVRATPLPPALVHRLARRLGATDVLDGVDPAALRRTVDLARMLVQHGASESGVCA
jgi:hypothetical protein